MGFEPTTSGSENLPQMPTTASFDCHPLPQPPKYQQLFRPLGGSNQAVASKLTDSSKSKVTVTSDTDIPAIDLVFLFYLIICLFCLFLFFLPYFLSIVFFFFLSFLSFFVFFCLFVFINLRTCNSIYILTSAQHSQASR